MIRRYIEIGILAFLVVAGILSHIFLEKRAVIAATTKIELSYKTQLVEAQKAAAKATADLNAYKVSADKEKQDAVQKIQSTLADTISGLQQRPTREELNSSIAAANARAKRACTGAQLFREDATFLAREAARADAVVVERNYYYEQYENARRTLAGEKPIAGLNGKTVDAKLVP